LVHEWSLARSEIVLGLIPEIFLASDYSCTNPASWRWWLARGQRQTEISGTINQRSDSIRAFKASAGM
jgi:hypothetical protein